MTVLLSIFILPALLLAMLIIPVVVALIYKGSYTRHLNELMMGDIKGKRWISPFALGAIIFLIEILILVGCFTLFMVNHSSNSRTEIDASENYSWTWPEGEVPEGEYREFNGDMVEGYYILERDDGLFHYTVYKKSAPESDNGPEYAICINYTGDGDVGSYMATTQFADKSGASGFGNTGTAADRYIGVIDTQHVIVRSITDDTENGTVTKIVDDYDFDVIYNFEVYDKEYEDMIDPMSHSLGSVSINLSELNF